MRRFYTKQELDEALIDHIEDEDEAKSVLQYRDMSEAVIGITQDNRLIYSFERMIKILMSRSIISRSEAMQDIDNIIYTHIHAENQPIIVYPLTYIKGTNINANAINTELCNIYKNALDKLEIIQFPDQASACIGVTNDNKLVYSYNKMFENLIDDNMTETDAIEWLDYNTVRTAEYLGQPYIEYPIGILGYDEDCFDEED